METEVVTVRLYRREVNHGHRGNLTQEILNILHDQRSAEGVTAFSRYCEMQSPYSKRWI